MSDIETQKQRLERQLDDWHERIEGLENTLDHAESDARARITAELKHLRNQRDQARHKLAQLKETDAEQWAHDDFRAGFLEIWDRIGQEIDAGLERLGHRRGAGG